MCMRDANNNNSTGTETMIYELSPAQKNILARHGENVNFKGDANDFSCLLSTVAVRLFRSGQVLDAWLCYQNDPFATYGTTFDAWESGMKTIVIRHLEMEKNAEAQAVAIGNAG